MKRGKKTHIHAGFTTTTTIYPHHQPRTSWGRWFWMGIAGVEVECIFSRHVRIEMEAWFYLLLVGAFATSSDLVGKSRDYYFENKHF